MAKSANSQRNKVIKKRMGVGFPIRLILFCILMAIAIKHSVIFVLAAMLPTIVAYIVDMSPQRYQLKTVGAINLAATAPYLAELVVKGNGADVVQNMMGTPMVWLVIYAAAGMGWVLVWLCPYAVSASIEFFSDNRVLKLQQEQEQLVGEWGEDVRKLATLVERKDESDKDGGL